MSEVIDRAVRALLAALEGSPNYVSANDACRSVTLDGVFDLREAVRAVIEAMREPSGPMQADGRDALLEYVDVLRKPVSDQWQLARDAYRAMIDAALSPSKEG